MLSKKTIRYYYWLALEFIKKHLRIILLSFLLSFIVIISFISFSPYIETFLFSKKNIVGIVGEYDFNNLPDEVISKISNGLLFINEKGEFVPALASTWEVSDKGKEYRFHLRDGLIWSDGKKFRAYDIVYQFKDITTKVLDDKTIYFKLAKPLPVFPTYLKKPITKYPLVGVAGLYKVDNMITKYGNITEVSLSPNKNDTPILQYKFFRTESELINAYKRGEINEMKITKKSLADVFKTWKNSVVTKTVDYTRLLTLFFNFNNEFLKQKEIRQTLLLAVERSKFEEFGELALGPIAPNSWAYNGNLKTPIFDRTAAEKTFKKETGATSSAQLNFYTYYDYLNYAEQITNDLKASGLDINLKLLSSERPDNFDLFLAFWNVPADPDQYFFWHSTQTQGNLGSYKNVKIDKLLEDGRNTNSLAEREKIYLEYQRVIVDDPPADFLYFPYVYTIKRK